MAVDLSSYLKIIEKASKKQESRIRKLNLTTEDLQAVDFNKLLNNSEQQRLEAIEELAASSYPNKLRVLLQLLQSEPSLDLRNEISRVLNEIQSKADFWGDELSSVIRRIRENLQSTDAQKVKEAVKEILSGRMTELLDYTLEVEKRFSEPYFRLANVRLITFRGVQFADQLLRYLRDKEEEVVFRAIEAIGLVGGEKEVFHIFPFLNHRHERLRKCAYNTLQILGKDKLQQILEKMSLLPKKEARLLCIKSIRLLNFKQSVPVLKRFLTDREPEIAQLAKNTLQAFGHLSEEEVAPPTPNLTDVSNNFALLSAEISQAQDPARISFLLGQLVDCPASNEEKLHTYMSFLQHPDDRVRANSLEYMAPYIPEDKLEFYTGYFNDPNNRIRGNAILAVARHKRFFQEREAHVTDAIAGLAKDPRPFYKLTALYCISILLYPPYLSFVLELLNCPIASVSAKSQDLLNSWEQTNPEAVNQAKKTYQQSKTTFSLPSDMEEKRKFINQSLTDPFVEKRQEFLNNLCRIDPDPSLGSILLPFFGQETFPILISLFIDALHYHGLEDRWYYFKNYLRSNDSKILLSAYRALVDVDGFPIKTQLEGFIHVADLSEGRNAEIMSVCLPQLVSHNRPLALKTMQRLSEGNEKCLRAFAVSLHLFTDPPPVLHRHALEVLSGAIEELTLRKCGDYLLKNLDTTTLSTRVKSLMQKSRYTQQKEYLESLLTAINEKIKSFQNI